MPVRDPFGATLAALGRANGLQEGVEGAAGWGGVGPSFAAQGLWALATDGWPALWVAVAMRSVVRLIRGADSNRRDQTTLWKVKRRVVWWCARPEVQEQSWGSDVSLTLKDYVLRAQ